MVSSLLFYNFILLSSTALLYVSEKERSELGKKVCLVLAFLISTIPNAIRYEIGSDYINYVSMFDRISFGLVRDIEPGFVFLNKLVQYSGLSYEWLFIVVAFFIHIFAFLSYPKRNMYLAHFMFMLLFYFSSFNILRQMMAVVIIMYALKIYLEKKKDINFYLMVAFASLFHSVALVFLFLPFVNNKVSQSIVRNFSWAAILFWLAVFLVGTSFVTVGVSLISVFEALDYSAYLEDVRYSASTEINTGLGVVFKAIIYIYPLLFASKLIKTDERNSLILILLICYIFLWASQMHLVIFARPAHAFEFVLIISTLMIFANTSIPFRKIYVVSFLLFMYLSFNKVIVDSHTSYMVTCKSGRLHPYVTIFNKEDSQRGGSLQEMACYL